MSGKERTYREAYEEMSSDEQAKHKHPDEIIKSLLETAPSLSSLPTASDFLNDQFEKDRKFWNLGKRVWDELNKLAEEAENHRIDYNLRSRDTEQPHYWRGRRDEAGHFRDKLVALMESLGK
jgi:hypothetical protein